MRNGVLMKKSAKLKEGVIKKSFTSKSHAESKKTLGNIVIAIDQVY